jgi:uncharacterized protein YjiS (DUF1127 family)
MELIMSTISHAAVSPQVGTVLQRSGSFPRSWLVAYITWRRERLGIRLLRSMSDRQLEDIGVSRSTIEFAVKAGPHHRTLSVFT